MTYLLASGLVAALALIGTLSIMLYKAQRETMTVRDLLDAEQVRSAEYKSGRDTSTSKVGVLETQLSQEQSARAIAETQRNEARARVQGLIKEHMEDASDDEISAMVDDVFAAPLRSVPPAVPEVPRADRPASDDPDRKVPM